MPGQFIRLGLQNLAGGSGHLTVYVRIHQLINSIFEIISGVEWLSKGPLPTHDRPAKSINFPISLPFI
jgi:hypothetical protein